MAVCLACTAYSQDALPDWVLQLARAKIHLKSRFEGLPNYVCSESVTRFAKPRAGSTFQELDTLRFEVAHVEGKELLALPGASHFEDLDLTTLNHGGAIGTGAFSSLPMTLFVHQNARIRPRTGGHGDETQIAFDYDVPSFLSGYQLFSGTRSAVVGQRGAFWLDARTLDILRAEDHAVDVPPMLGMTAVDTTTEYANVRVGSQEALLPKSASTTVTAIDGSVHRNDISFSGCREYSSESTIRFLDPPKE